ncbi:c-type cytochrome [Ruegeria arenilitoris]|uniref:c-type cytochrome n=1 Tax=Ruegeria arenilitoris TaxID=1173585 RepID=UPI00147A9AC7|nr:c-type cytochrome [Ruegeria arenilitoris]
MRLPHQLFFVIVGGVLTPVVATAEDLGDAEAGKVVFEECSSCHQVGKGAENKIGPHLNGVFGRKAAGLEGFNYSKSLTRAGNSGLEWHADTLSDYVENPRAFASGTRMNFAGLKNPEDRANVVAYLRGFSDNPSDIPEADPTAKGTDHSIDPEILAIQGDPEYGAYLSNECTTCHQIEGGDEGIPSIVYWPAEDFVVALHAYKEKKRPHPVMQMIAGRLNNDEIAALAAYFNNPE